MNPPPIVHTLLAADRIARSKSDGRCDLFGVFHALNLRLPTHLTFAVYYVLTGVHGAADLDIVFLAPDDTRLCGGPVHIPISDPLAAAQGMAGFPPPDPGDKVVSLLRPPQRPAGRAEHELAPIDVWL